MTDLNNIQDNLEPKKKKMKTSKIDTIEEQHLINEPKAEQLYASFEQLYAKSIVNLKNNKFDLESIENNYKKFKLIKSKNVKFIIANVGYPNTQKSSFFNYLKTGTYQHPLPNSSKSGISGETLKPTRCYFTNSKQININAINQKSDYLNINSFNSFDKSFNECLKTLMKNQQIVEIIIELPKSKYPAQATQFQNFVFLDLIGLPNKNATNSNSQEKQDDLKAIKLNKQSIEREFIDAVFLFPGNRHHCETKLIKELWKIGVFTNLEDMRPPKIIATAKFRLGDWITSNDLSDRLNGFCQNEDSMDKNNIKDYLTNSIKRIFDFSDLNTDLDEIIDIENKEKNVKELISRATTLCALEINSTENKYETKAFKQFEKHLKSIIDDIRRHKHDFVYQESFCYIIPTIKDLSMKINAKINSVELNKRNQNLHNQICGYFESTQYHRLLSKHNKFIANEIDKLHTSYLEQEDNELFLNETDPDYDTCKPMAISTRFKQIFTTCLSTVTQIYYRFIEELKICLKDKFKIVEWNRNKTIDIEVCQMELKSITKQQRKNIFTGTYQGFELENQFNIIKDSISIQKKESQRLFIQIIHSETDSSLEYLKIHYKKLIDFETQTNQILKPFFEFQTKTLDNVNQHIKPILFQEAASNKLPSSQDLNKDLTPKDIKKFFKGNLKGGCHWEQMLKEGKIKSKLSLQFKENQTNDFVQFYINRNDKQVSVEYNTDFITNKLNSLHENIYKDVNSLYPIFISSRLKRDKNKNIISTGEENILSKNLGTHLNPNTFLIFLFIEAGLPTNRKEFNDEIKFYTKLKADHFDCILKSNAQYKNDPQHNPIVLCYLPEKNLNIGCVRKMKMLFAEHLMLRRFYFLDDKIETFYEYDQRIGERKMATNQFTAFRSLDFMLKVLEDELAKREDDFSKDDLENWRDEIAFLLKTVEKKKSSEEYKYLENLKRLLYIFRNDKISTFKSEVFDLLNKIKIENDVLNDMKQKLMGDKSKIIGQIALWNRKSYLSGLVYENRLQTNAKNIKTHLISSERDKVILYNLDAIKGIHTVSDASLFATPLSIERETELLKSYTKRDFSNLNVCKAATLGYENIDKVHAYYQILNTVSGFLVYYFAFGPKVC